MNKKDFDDYFMAQATGLSRGSVMSEYGAGQHQRAQDLSRRSYPSPTSTPTAPLFPWVDDLFARIPRVAGRALAILLALVALGIAVEQGAQGWEPVVWAAVGFVAGMLILPVVKVSLKLTLLLLKLAIIGAILYGVITLITAA